MGARCIKFNLKAGGGHSPGLLTGAWKLALLLLLGALTVVNPARCIDLRNATIIAPPNLTAPEQRAIRMLVEEVQKRTGIEWRQSTDGLAMDETAIIAGTEAALSRLLETGSWRSEIDALRPPDHAEGYRLRLAQRGTTNLVFVVGRDSRGLLFGVGRLLRELRLDRGAISAPDQLDLASFPKYPLRGHQLGYRPKCNSYDAWNLAAWEQYFRDLAVFGCNAIELIPPRSDDDADSPHFPLPPMEMMQGMSRVADAYGLDVWIWYPAMDKDYSDARTVALALKEWGSVFSRLSRVDAVFVPGGDPGHTPPKILLALLEKQTQNLHRWHPKAQMWVSPQGFNQEWLDEFLGLLQKDQPAWLSGIVSGPQVRISLERLRQMLPAKYPIRHYPDITHSRQCQYPVPAWDRAYAVTEGRECINPRPEDQAVIFRRTQPGTLGFITYSEGCNDDVNKAVWSVLGWDPETPVKEILRQYSRYFISDRYSETFAHGLLGLERNWNGPLAANPEVERTFQKFQEMERTAAPRDLRNWRFQQALFRAYFDAYTKRRLKVEESIESRAIMGLSAASETGAESALAKAEAALAGAAAPANDPLRTRIFQLAEALFQSIGMQLSVAQYRAIGVGRGASLDTLDFSLNNRVWLTNQFAQIRKLEGESNRLNAIAAIVNWTDPGPGGFYDDLGNTARQPHLLTGLGFQQDPASFDSPRVNFADEPLIPEPGGSFASARRTSWWDHEEALYDAPLQMAYTNLDATAHYSLRVVYGGDGYARKIRLVANGTVEIHPLIEKPIPFKPLEFSIPAEATRGGKLILSWTAEPGLGGNGRACQVSEVWLLRKP